MQRGFTLIEMLVIVAIIPVVLAIVLMNIRGCSNDDWAFATTPDKDIKLISNPVTGEVSECIRPFVFGDWRCRPISPGVKKPVEKP